MAIFFMCNGVSYLTISSVALAFCTNNTLATNGQTIALQIDSLTECNVATE